MKHPKFICPLCKKRIAATKDFYFRQHSIGKHQRYQTCAGSHTVCGVIGQEALRITQNTNLEQKDK